jgi:hypothetical protein
MQGIVELRAPAPAPALPQKRLRAARRRLTALICAVVAVMVVAVAAIALAGGSGVTPPAEGAAGVVPADALAYVHLSTDSGRPAVRQALALAARLPGFHTLAASVTGRLAAIAGGSASDTWAGQVRPWLGREAALAFLNTPTATADSLLVLGVANQSQAHAFVARSGVISAGSYRGTRLYRYPAGTELAFVKHYLAVGDDASVRASIDAAAGASGVLSSDSAYRRAQSGVPADRVLEAYASVSGVKRLLGAQHGAIGALGSLLYSSPALAGVSIAVSPSPSGVHLTVHSVLDPTLARVSAAPPAPFVPTLERLIPAGSPFVLDLAGLDGAAPRILGAAAAAGIAGRVEPLLQRLGGALRAEGVNIPSLLSIFHGETAIAVAPAASLSRPPSLVIVTRTADPARTSAQLAGLEVPLAQLFPPPASGSGQEPLFGARTVAGITAQQLSLTPGLELDYAVTGGLVVISTSLDGIAAVVHHEHAIAQEHEFSSTMAGNPQRVTSLLFLDFSQLLSLGEQMGITRNATLTALQPDLQRIRAVGLSSKSGEDDSTAELTLQIS